MENKEIIVYILLIVPNLLAGFGLAVPISRQLVRINGSEKMFYRYFGMLVGIYFVECVAFSAGMATQVFSIGLAFIWGGVLGLWLRSRAPARKILKTSFFAHHSRISSSWAVKSVLGSTLL